MKNTYLWRPPRTEWLWIPLDEATPSGDSSENLSNRCSTDWNSRNARDTSKMVF